MSEQKLRKDFRHQSISTEFEELFTFACEATIRQHMDGVISSAEYAREFYNWIKPKDARNDEKFRTLIEAVTGNAYTTFEKWQSNGSPQKGDKALLCFSASAQFHGNTHIEEHFAKFLHFWNTFREKRSVQPDFAEYKAESKKLLEKYRLISTKRRFVERYPFATQLQRHFPSQDFKHIAKFNDIRLFIDIHPSGYVMIEDGVGTEKSPLAAYTAKTLYDTGQYQCIWHFIEMGSGHNRSADLLRTLFLQLKDMYPSLESDHFALEYERVLNLDAGYAAFYKTVFDQLAYDDKFLNGKLVILVDALDEVSQSDPSRQESANTLFLPQSLIGNAFIVVTSKSFKRENYIGNKLEIKLSAIESCQENEQTHVEPRCGIERVAGKDKWLDPYNHEELPLVGREQEFELLDKFIEANDRFKIWAIVGPSGAGKTRLASQWAYESPALKGWDRRVLHKEDRIEPEKWLDWLSDKPTLLIIDYMYGFDEVISKLMNQRLEPNVPKIRLLLIDHVFSEPLHSDKRWGFSGDGSSLNRNEKYFFDTKPLDLRHTQDQIIKSIIAHRAGIDEKSDQVDKANEYLLNLKEQSAYHPLFAALIGDAIKSGKNFKVWNRRELIDYYLSGDKRLPWKHEGNIGRWASHFIAVATARRGINYRDLIEAAGNCISSPELFDDVKAISQKVIADHDAVILSPFEPDILGESFFLKFLQFLEESPKYRNEFQQVFMAGNEETQIKDAIEFIAFIQRLTRNLLNDDQSQKETLALWDSLFDFMNPSEFENTKPIQWAVTISLIDIVNKTKYQFSKEKLFTLLNKIEPAILYNDNNESSLEVSIQYSMHHFELMCEYTKTIFRIPEEMFALFDRKYTKNNTGETPLIIACQLGFNKMIHALIDCGVDAEATLRNGQNALIISSFKGNAKAVQSLLNSTKTNINTTDDQGCTALLWACINHTRMISEGYAALIWANCSGLIETVRLLLDKRANIDVIDNKGRTALIFSSSHGNIEMVRLLLNKKAKIDIADKNGCTALMWACCKGHIEIVKLLLDEDAKIDAADNEGCTALMWACCKGHTEIVKLLLDEDAKIDAIDNEGCTALMWACCDGHPDTVKLLVDKEAKIDAIDNEGCTALIWACVDGHIETVRILLDKITKKDVQSKTDLSTAFILAISKGHLEVVMLLLEKGAEVNATDNEKGRSALIWACLHNHIRVVKFLLEQNVLINIIDNYGQTALSIAQKKGYTEITQLLIEHGAEY